jgi:hypothetical protein
MFIIIIIIIVIIFNIFNEDCPKDKSHFTCKSCLREKVKVTIANDFPDRYCTACDGEDNKVAFPIEQVKEIVGLFPL